MSAKTNKRKKLRKLRQEEKKKEKRKPYKFPQPRSLEELDRRERVRKERQMIIPILPEMDYAIPLISMMERSHRENKVIVIDKDHMEKK